MTAMVRPNSRVTLWLALILALALVLRLGYALAQNPLEPYDNTSADGFWYLNSGLQLVSGEDFLHLPTAPVYMIFVGIPQQLFSREGAVIAVRIIQAFLGAATCYLAYRLALRLTGLQRAGLIAAGVLAISPVFIIEAAQVATETLYLFLVAAALTVYVTSIDQKNAGWRPLLAVAFLFGVATLTRAVSLAFPIGLAIHLLMVCGWRAGLRRAFVLLLAYALVVSTWTVYNVVRFDRWVIGAEGLAAFIYIGATGYTSPQDVDARLSQDAGAEVQDDASYEERQEAYLDAASNVIGSDPLGYIGRRLSELANAFLQPHGTVFFPGESLRELVLTWAREDRSVSGLLALTQGDAFWPKLAIYVFHYAGLIGGLVGIWLYRRRWRVALPLIGFIIYTALVHLVLLALPRYIFPTALCWWVFAAAAFAGTPEPVTAIEKQPARQQT
jgi:4-amino-4-deoxy-L-arabinose transferase-like glycosyltransferase